MYVRHVANTNLKKLFNANFALKFTVSNAVGESG